MTRKIEIERFTLTSSKPFDGIISDLKAAVGQPDIAAFWRSTHRAQSITELESTIEKAVGQTGLMLFTEFDHGAIVRKGTGRDTPKNSASSLAIHLSCDGWFNMFPMLAPTPP